MKFKIDEALEKHNIAMSNITEFDTWVNDATREDINIIVEKQDVFGLKLWSYKIIARDKLKDICNFGVTFIFKIKYMSKIIKYINGYKKYKEFDMARSSKFVSNIIDLAVYACLWV